MKVHVPNLGYAKYSNVNDSLVNVSQSISNIAPVSGSAGGTLLTITGSGFSSKAVVTFTSSGTCAIQTVSETQIVCRTSAGANGEVKVKQAEIFTVTSTQTFASNSITPTISSFTPASFTGNTQLDLTISSYDASTITSLKVSLSSKQDLITPISTTSFTLQGTNVLRVNLNDIPTGEYEIDVLIDGKFYTSFSGNSNTIKALI
jgi:hypothetical protein